MADGVTVVIPTHNRWDRLRASLAMVLTQSYQGPLEVIVVDDGGSDGTAEHLRDLGDPRIRVVRRLRAGGVSTARNAGLAAATHPWVAFTDDDDLWAPTKLERQLDAVQAAGGECWCAGAAVTLFGGWSVLDREAGPPAASEVVRQVLSDNHIPGGGSGVLVSTALARRVGGFDPGLSLLADWDLWIRLALAAPFVPVDDVLLCYVMHDTSMSLDATRSLQESAILRDRYAEHRIRHGVGHYGGAREWIAGNQERAGNRLPAMRIYGRLALETRRASFARPLVRTLLGPAVCARVPGGLKWQTAPSATALSFVEDLRRALAEAQVATGLDDASWTDARQAAPGPVDGSSALGAIPVDPPRPVVGPPAPDPEGISPSPSTG